MNTMTLNVREMRRFARESIRNIAENWPILLFSALFLCGLVCGCFLLKNGVSRAGEFAEMIVKKLTDAQWSVRLKPLLAEVSAGLLLAFFAGFSAVGLPVILCLPCAKGLAYGALAAQLYTVYRVKGVLFSLIVLFPFLAAEITVLVVGLRDSMQLSSSLFSAFRGGVSVGERGEVKAYCLRFSVFSVVSVAIILLQSFFSGVIGSALLS